VQTWSTLRDPGLDREDPANWIDWLDDEEMLPAAFPTARILRYGYRSDWFGEAALNTRATTIAEGLLDELRTARKDVPLRPLIFIAHSFGGLVLLKVRPLLHVLMLKNRTDPSRPSFLHNPKNADGLGCSKTLSVWFSSVLHFEGRITGFTWSSCMKSKRLSALSCTRITGPQIPRATGCAIFLTILSVHSSMGQDSASLASLNNSRQTLVCYSGEE